MMLDATFQRWWWRAWYALVAAACLWFGLGLWVNRAPARWAEGWVGWWAGDRMGGRPVSTARLIPVEGAEVAMIEGDAVLRIGQAGRIELGHWRESLASFTWAGWVRVSDPGSAWPEGFLTVRELRSARMQIRLGFLGGRPAARLEVREEVGGAVGERTFRMEGAAAVRLGEWVHFAFSTDRGTHRLVVNGETVAEGAEFGFRRLPFSSLTLRGELEVEALGGGALRRQVAEQDEVVLFKRVLGAEELAELAAGGRGGWVRELDRVGQGRRWWRWGWIWAAAAAGLVGLRIWPGMGVVCEGAVRALARPGYREMRWVLLVGLLVTGLLSGVLARQAKQEDRRRFADALYRLWQDSDAHWEHLAGLLNRARDWIAARSEVTLEDWDTWLLSNRFPHDYAGVLGVGYAEQVLPGELAAHEAVWARRHGFDYRVHPGCEVERHPVRELEGDPRLPVVLFETRTLDRSVWLTNQTILGRDLLYQAVDDPRPWAAARRVEEVAARNEVQTSSMETIAPAEWYGDAVRGLELYVPWTLRTKRVEGPDEPLESAAWRGVVFAQVDPAAVLREALGSVPPLVGFRIHTGEVDGRIYDLVADSGDLAPSSAEPRRPAYRETFAIPFYYRRLWVDAWSTSAFDAQSLARWPWYVGVAGTTLTLLTASLMFVQGRAREKEAEGLAALRLAHQELLQAQHEREALSRDLHDGSIQNLYGLGLQLQRIQQQAEARPAQTSAEIAQVLTMLDQTIADLRRFMLSADRGAMDTRTVAEAVEGLAERWQGSSQARFELDLDPGSNALSPAQGIHVLNIVREAVSNAVRHGRAQCIRVALGPWVDSHGGSGGWRLEISDDGCGFAGLGAVRSGHGLENLARRATELGGRFELETAPGAGTRVRVLFDWALPVSG